VQTIAQTWTVALAQAGPGAAPVEPGLGVKSVFDFVVKGGPVMIPIALCSMVALAVIIERLVALRRKRVIPRDFLPGLGSAMAGGDRAAAVDYCQKDGSPVGAVFATAIKRLGEPIDLLERHISEAGEREVVKLRKRLRLLAVIASVAPLLGLLGTITGMITAFQTVAASGEALGKTELLAKGIYEAMITTAAGLVVAIPVLLCYQWIQARIESMVSEIDAMTVGFIEEYALGKPAPKVTANGSVHAAGHADTAHIPVPRTASEPQVITVTPAAQPAAV